MISSSQARALLSSTLFVSTLLGHPVTAQQSDSASGSSNKDLPLEAGRTVSLSTNEGTWMSLDVSPDGQTIVFDLLGDLYTVPIGGGNGLQLTGGMAFDAQPRFSPDGQSVVYTSDYNGGENLWIMALDGSDTTRLTTSRSDSYRSPEFTPDGKYVIASKGGASKLWMYHVDGGSGIQMVDEPGNLHMVGAAFGADDRYIWYAERSGAHRYNTPLPTYQLAVYDRETGRRYARSDRYGSAFRPTVSPDGRWLAYGTRHEEDTGIRLRDLRNGSERWLAYPVQRDDQESPATRDVLPGMSFTPDSRQLVATYGGRIWRIPIDGSEPIEVPFQVDIALPVGPEVDFDYAVSDEPTFVAQQIRDAVPSPDGNRLAFVALDRLWVMGSLNGTPRRLTDATVAEHQPTWSPDGRWLAYATWSDADGGYLVKARSDGSGDPQRLTPTAGYYSQPAWAPDGQRIVAVRTAARNFVTAIARGGSSNGEELIWVPANGGQVSIVGPTEGIASPHFTTDPHRIYAYSSSDGLISMRWDGTDAREHVRIRGGRPPGSSQGLNASLIMMAPTGDQALAQIQNNLFVVTVPRIGGDTPTISVDNPDNAQVPAQQLTTAGGQFPAWERGGRRIHWSLGNAHFVYDMDAAQAFEDSVETADRADADEPQAIRTPEEAAADSTDEDEDEEDDARYAPMERRIEITGTRDIPNGVVALQGARIVTMRGDEVIQNGVVVIRNNRIAQVGARDQVQVPGDAHVIDVAGTTIVPGFIDTHAHLRPMYGIHKVQVWSFLANLAYGVTTTRDPQTFTTDVLSYEDMVDAGEILGPRIYSTGPGLFSNEMIEDQEHAREVMRRYSRYYDTKTLKMYVSGNRQQRQWIIKAAREQQLMPTTEGGLDFKLNLTNTIDGYPGMEHSIPVYPLYRDVIELFAQTGRVYTPTLLVAYGGPWAENYFYATEEVHDDAKLNRFTPHQEIDSKTLRRGGPGDQAGWFRREQHVFDDHARFVADLVAAGGRAGVGSHGQLQGLGYHWELWAMQSGGLSEHDALRVATQFGAEAIGLDNDLGSIESGKLADLLVLNGNPLETIRATNTIRYVMKNGRLYEGDTLNEVWPRERELAPLHWREHDPDVAAGIH